jgi:hypothetical protein
MFGNPSHAVVVSGRATASTHDFCSSLGLLLCLHARFDWTGLPPFDDGYCVTCVCAGGCAALSCSCL